MATVAAKRMEARRRRILENSEDRLKKITGLYSSGPDDHTESVSPEMSSTKEEQLLPSPAEVNSTTSREVPSHRTVQSFMDTPPPPEDVPITENSLWHHISNDIHDKKESCPFSGFQQEPEAPLLHPLIRLRLHIIALAIVVRAILSSPFSFFIGQSAVVPLLSVELIGMLHEKWTGAESQRNANVCGFFSAALVLSGFSYMRVQQITTTLSVFSQFFDDLCIYVFVFVFTHVVLEMFS